MTPRTTLLAALAGVGLAAAPGYGFHPHVQYVKVPVVSGPAVVGAPAASGFSVVPAATGFSFGVPAATGFSFGIPAATGFTFGVPASGFNFGVPASGFSFGAGGNAAFGADAQGAFDQILLRMLLSNFGRGGGTSATITNEQIKSLANELRNQAGLNDLKQQVDNANARLRALLKAANLPVNPPGVKEKEDSSSAPPARPVLAGAYATARDRATGVTATTAPVKAPAVAGSYAAARDRAAVGTPTAPMPTLLTSR